MNELEKVLNKVEKPARYIGGEWNSVCKNWNEGKVKMVFAFPDLYEIGMSHLGLQIIYKVVNDREDALMERVFAPWIDMEHKMRELGLPLFSLESHRPVADFDIIGFTLQYEMSYTNVLNMLNLAGISLHSENRGAGSPLVIAGGPCSFNPEPLAPFIDVFVIGEGEEVINSVIDTYVEKKKNGSGKKEILSALACIEGIYVPSFYRFTYSESETVDRMDCDSSASSEVRKSFIRDVDNAAFPTRPIVPHTEVVHDRIMLEIMRGCTRGCRFCQAGMIYRPVREKNLEILLQQAKELVSSTGWDEISLTSLSSSDYTRIKELTSQLVNRYESDMINTALPSLRADAFSVELAKEVQKVRRSSLTFAPEAGTQRMRDIINKGVNEENLLDAVKAAFTAGWTSIKLYYMIGLPGETDNDLEGIGILSKKVLSEGRSAASKKGKLKVTSSASSFVPKPHTPFQWEPQASLEELKRKQDFLKQKLRGKGLVFNWHDPELSILEGDLARGNRKMAPVLEKAWLLGCRFDGWDECFDFQKWCQAFYYFDMEPSYFACRVYRYDDILPWDHINCGVSKKFLASEHKKALEGINTADCREGKCPGCGICRIFKIKPYTAEGDLHVQVQDSL
ncbi:MAG: TIGR03960 family B12-binding radical SAM protein [Clostridiales bacterium]|nr:TIGR03960 family B12-binding radical SAM protein [Clostridiales bacterium]MCF8022286.1 TIGR03960 family B12-binding radical SAM protein [Clostridiales bacterium]